MNFSFIHSTESLFYFPTYFRYSLKHFQPLLNRTNEKYELFCEKCGQIVSDVDSLMQHVENLHEKKTKSWNVSSNSTTRPYLCDVCGKGYTQSSHLYQHLRFHNGMKL